MSIHLHNRIRILEQELIEVKARLELLETPREPFVDPFPAFEKRGPGRPKKVVDAQGH